MEITRLNDARRYDAPKHFDMRSLRLQGFDASASSFAWVGLSHFLPGGGAEMDQSPLEKIYVVLAGEITIELADGTIEVLGVLDSCFIAGGEARAIRNEANGVASMLVAMPYPKTLTRDLA
jgi:quercetin dioxygenase-like cupin family protein